MHTISASHPVDTAEPLLAALRLATASRHEATESLLALDRIHDLRRYGRVMAAFEYFLRQWEPAVLHGLPARLHDWFARRSRLHLARADLRALGETAIVALPDDPARSIPLSDIPSVLGSLYVMEGSALGGRVVALAMERRFDLDRDTGAAYFNGFGERVGPMWREFRELLRSETVADPCFEERACGAARATFDGLAHVFRQSNAADVQAASAL